MGDSGLCLASGGKSNMAGFMGFMVISWDFLWDLWWFFMGSNGILWDLPSGDTWLENPRTEWRLIARKITELNSMFSSNSSLITGG